MKKAIGFGLASVLTGLLLSSSPAHARNGGSEGGGNLAAGKMIEQYACDPNACLPGFKAASERLLAKAKALNPELASALEQNMQSRTWYLIPEDFEVLPSKKTGLRFATSQGGYQNENEVFTSKKALAKMDEETRDTFYSHEMVMTLFPAKTDADHQGVREITNTLLKSKGNSKDLQATLEKYDVQVGKPGTTQPIAMNFNQLIRSSGVITFSGDSLKNVDGSLLCSTNGNSIYGQQLESAALAQNICKKFDPTLEQISYETKKNPGSNLFLGAPCTRFGQDGSVVKSSAYEVFASVSCARKTVAETPKQARALIKNATDQEAEHSRMVPAASAGSAQQ